MAIERLTFVDELGVERPVDAGHPLPVGNPAAYETVAAGASNQILGATGAIGDYIQRLIIQPTTVAPGVVTLKDNTTTVYAYPGGTVGADLKPFIVELGIKCLGASWNVTTGSNVTAIGIGKFT